MIEWNTIKGVIYKIKDSHEKISGNPNSMVILQDGDRYSLECFDVLNQCEHKLIIYTLEYSPENNGTIKFNPVKEKAP
jgi:hypothetical protein